MEVLNTVLGPHQLCQMDEQVLKVMKTFALSQNWHIQDRQTNLHRFACLLLPNGQIARSLWHEKKHPVEKVRVARNVKVRVSTFSEGLANCTIVGL